MTEQPQVERMMAMENGLMELLGNYFADHGVDHATAAILLAAALGRLLADRTGTHEEWKRNLASVETVIESFAGHTGDETSH